MYSLPYIWNCVEQNKIPKKQKMSFNESNVVEKWNKWFPESVEVDDSDTESV